MSGNGQTELAEVICALRGLESGSITVDGSGIASMSVRAVTDLGVGHIPEDRIGTGMVLSASVKDNAVLHNYWTEQFAQGLTLNRQGVIDFARRLVEAARVQTRSIFATAGQLSGGNQQRLVARREALAADRLLVAAHPHQGARRERGPGGQIDDPQQARQWLRGAVDLGRPRRSAVDERPDRRDLRGPDHGRVRGGRKPTESTSAC